MPKIIIEVSARHCHLSQKDLERLFGVGYQLKILKPLSQTSQFAAKETVVLKNKFGALDLRVLGPTRAKTQVELSATDARKLKINPPVRLSGDLKESLGGIMVGPKGQVVLKEGIIIAERHIHCDPATAKKLKISAKKKYSVKTLGERSVIFNNISVRVGDDFVFRMHIDTDEGNAGLVGGVCSMGELLN